MANASLQSFLLPQHHSFASNGGSHDGSPSALFKLSTNTGSSISFRLHPNTSRSVTTTSTTNSSAPTPVAPAAASAAEEDSSPAPSLDLLSRQLAAGDYRQADETTRALIIDLAGESARRRGYVFFSEVQFISAEDLRAIDELWKEHSNGKFGYSVQRRLWEKSQRDFTRFFIRVGWMKKLRVTCRSPMRSGAHSSWGTSSPTRPSRRRTSKTKLQHAKICRYSISFCFHDASQKQEQIFAGTPFHFASMILPKNRSRVGCSF